MRERARRQKTERAVTTVYADVGESVRERTRKCIIYTGNAVTSHSPGHDEPATDILVLIDGVNNRKNDRINK